MAVHDHVPAATVVDGELVSWVNGRLDFGALQRRNVAGGHAHDIAAELPCHYIVFDLLEREGEDLRPLPLLERRQHLEDLFANVPKTSPLTLGMHTADRDEALIWFEKLRDVGVEGLVVKTAGECYRAGARGWRKIKAYATTDAIIGGITGTLDHPENVILGRYDTHTQEFRMVARTVPIPEQLVADPFGIPSVAAPSATWHRGSGVAPCATKVRRRAVPGHSGRPACPASSPTKPASAPKVD